MTIITMPHQEVFPFLAAPDVFLFPLLILASQVLHCSAFSRVIGRCHISYSCEALDQLRQFRQLLLLQVAQPSDLCPTVSRRPWQCAVSV